jgi:hypothetical protein
MIGGVLASPRSYGGVDDNVPPEAASRLVIHPARIPAWERGREEGLLVRVRAVRLVRLPGGRGAFQRGHPCRPRGPGRRLPLHPARWSLVCFHDERGTAHILSRRTGKCTNLTAKGAPRAKGMTATSPKSRDDPEFPHNRAVSDLRWK